MKTKRSGRPGNQSAVGITRQWMRTGEVAMLLGLARGSVCRLVKEGKLPAQRLPGGHARFDREAILALLARAQLGPRLEEKK